jgi:hypothetical protein
MKYSKKLARIRNTIVAAVAIVTMTGCSDFFDVTNPGVILDADLNSVRGALALVTGMSSDFSEGYDGAAFAVARLSDEMAGSGSYNSTGDFRRGDFRSDDANGYWNDIQRARWVAEDGLRRMRDDIEGFPFDNNELTARAYLLAGMANRWFGETFCQIIYEAGEAQPKSAAFNRALPQFDEAIKHGGGAGASDIVTAARGGKMQAYVGLGDWGNAVTMAALVPTDFVYEVVYSDNSGREQNEIFNETHGRYEMSAYDTWAELNGSESKRTPFTDCRESPLCSNAQGADGQTPHLRQEKYDSRGSNMVMVSGVEARLVEAEAAIANNDLTLFHSKINEVRAHYGLGLYPNAPTEAGDFTGDWEGDSAREILDRERYLSLWLDGRRLWDMHRWDHPFLDGGSIAGYTPRAEKRTSCFPMADSECQTNPNASGLCI